ncbi:hypothetical protein BDK51DRAFT_41876 [Blyttiomyces helicus]|uniref:Uncharacterized protein n=1 Tax=Blyttiomyces helicus TaxID=388810 RepID=A0A4P9WF29_9FUNG|nr:hypothetical protein BDK51DRAFT_41876 [Blyttiomyces helicus]|eukprot:RKO90333.1 hypothetical protein BDK51DRAFT_41876 [Blyttiomyces helicus]
MQVIPLAVFVAYGAASFSSSSPGSASSINVGLPRAICARGIPMYWAISKPRVTMDIDPINPSPFSSQRPNLEALPIVGIPQTSCADCATDTSLLPAAPVVTVPLGRSVPAPALGALSSGTSTPPGKWCRSASLSSSPAARVAAPSFNLKSTPSHGFVIFTPHAVRPDTAECVWSFTTCSAPGSSPLTSKRRFTATAIPFNCAYAPPSTRYPCTAKRPVSPTTALRETKANSSSTAVFPHTT